MDLKTHTTGSVKILRLSGSFDAYSAAPVRTWFEETTSTRPAHIVINLEKVSFLDSTALSVLVQGVKRARQNTGDVRLCKLQAPVRMVFELTRLDQVFEIFNNEEDAAQAFGDEPLGASSLHEGLAA